jgi:hypothetical protein
MLDFGSGPVFMAKRLLSAVEILATWAVEPLTNQSRDLIGQHVGK